LARSKVTAKYQVTIPREVREKIEVRPGEIVTVEAVSHDEIVLKRFSRVKDPLDTLIGKASRGTVAVTELEEKMESR
jgi:AbrB family looped-hinge helix DNA binding protein